MRVRVVDGVTEYWDVFAEEWLSCPEFPTTLTTKNDRSNNEVRPSPIR